MRTFQISPGYVGGYTTFDDSNYEMRLLFRRKHVEEKDFHFASFPSFNNLILNLNVKAEIVAYVMQYTPFYSFEYLVKIPTGLFFFPRNAKLQVTFFKMHHFIRR